MEGRRPNRRNNNPFGGPLPFFGISIFAVSNDPEPDELVSDNEDNVNDVEKKKAIKLKQRIASFSDPTKFCRICLCCDRKLYAIPPKNRAAFRNVLNKDIEAGNQIPQRVCVDCNAKMTTFSTFRTRALQTNSLLYTIIRPYADEDEPPYGPDTSVYSPAPAASPPAAALTPLRARQAAALRAEQRRGAALPATLNISHLPIFTDYHNQVWIAWWGPSGVRMNGRAGDRVAALCSRAPRDAAHARQLVSTAHAHTVDILFHRVPLGKIYVITKRDQESLGLKLDSECNITGVAAHSACARAGLPPPGAWALTEINNRPVNLLKGGEDDMNRLSKHGTEVSILIQPSAFVKKLRSSLKGNKTLLGLR